MEDIVATLRVETKRVAVRSTDWLGDWLLIITDMVERASDNVENARIVRAYEIITTIDGLDDNPRLGRAGLESTEHAIDDLRDFLRELA